ncbi:hypothetical protein L1887_33449 [Cichorium endivia]|nr:hypothetical protein L1887_33449 [Cichorium endivia]
MRMHSSLSLCGCMQRKGKGVMDSRPCHHLGFAVQLLGFILYCPKLNTRAQSVSTYLCPVSLRALPNQHKP